MDIEKAVDSFAFIITSGFLLLAAFYQIYKAKFGLIVCNCWFCKEDTWVERKSQTWWYCASCQQWNGFDKNGDYKEEVSDMYEERDTTYALQMDETRSQSKEKNVLCKKCIKKQNRKIIELANFSPKNETTFESECLDFERFVEEKYKPCIGCRTAVNYHLQQQDMQIRSTQPYASVQPSDQLNMSALRKLNALSVPKKNVVWWLGLWHLISSFAALWLYSSQNHYSSSVLYIMCMVAGYLTLNNKQINSAAISCCLWWILVLVSFTPFSSMNSTLLLFLHDCCTIANMLSSWFTGLKNCCAFKKLQKSKVNRLKHTTRIRPEETCDEHPAEFTRISPKQVNATPDLLEGHLNSMRLGIRPANTGGGDRNHVMAALKYSSPLPFTDSRSNRPLLRPSQLAQNKQTANEQPTANEYTERQDDVTERQDDVTERQDDVTPLTTAGVPMPNSVVAIEKHRTSWWRHGVLVAMVTSLLINISLYQILKKENIL